MSELGDLPKQDAPQPPAADAEPEPVEPEPEPEPERPLAVQQMLKTAVEKLKAATALDEAMCALAPDDPARKEMARDAIEMYTAGLEYMAVARKHCRNAAVEKWLLAKMEGYITRAEQLKQLTPALASGAKTESGGGPRLRPDWLDSLVCTPNIRWDDVAGMGSQKQSLREVAVQRTAPMRGVLLYGPAGCGKTYLAKACGTESVCHKPKSGSRFLCAIVHTLLATRQGLAQIVSSLFEEARQKSSLIFFDEFVDEGDPDHPQFVAFMLELRRQMDAPCNKDVVVLAATKEPWLLDEETLLRFPLRIQVTLPDATARIDCVKAIFESIPHELSDADWAEIGERTQGFSGADLNCLARDAMMGPVRALQVATHFKTVSGVDRAGNRRGDMLSACSPNDPDPTKVARTLMDLTDEEVRQLAEPIFRMEHARAALDESLSHGLMTSEEDFTLLAGFNDRWGIAPFSDVLHEARALYRTQQRLVFALGVLTVVEPPHLASLPVEVVAKICDEVWLSCPCAEDAPRCSRQPCES